MIGYHLKIFYRDMGERPEGMTLDRIDVNGDYCKENCRWATFKEQANNMRSNTYITFNNITKTISQWADYTGIKKDTLRNRLDRYHWSIERALTENVHTLYCRKS